MTVPHRVVVCPIGLEVVTTAPSYYANQTSSYTISASGNALNADVAGTQYSIWDTSVRPHFSTGLLTAGNTITLPLRTDLLPPYLFDAIIKVLVNGKLCPVAMSNSPDNAATYNTTQPLVDKVLYWTDLIRATYGNLGNYDYAWSTIADIPNGNGGTIQSYNPFPFRIHFNEPTPVSATFTATVQYISLVNSNNNSTTTYTTTVPQGVTEHVIATYPGLGIFPISPSLFKVTISSSNTVYRSLLPIYHWSICGSLVAP